MSQDAATPRTVLIGDDDPQVCAMIELALRKNRLGSRRADSIKNIDAAVKTGEVGVVLLDLVLGRENGWEALRLLRLYSDVPIIVMTGAGVDEEVRLEACKLGAQGVLHKPFEVQDLMGLIYRHLGGGSGPNARRREG